MRLEPPCNISLPCFWFEYNRTLMPLKIQKREEITKFVYKLHHLHKFQMCKSLFTMSIKFITHLEKQTQH